MKTVFSLIISFTTYNRCDYLREAIESWNNTRNRDYKWTLIVADDGSTDDTKDYLQNLFIEDIEFYVIPNKRRGVHYQKNSIIKLCSELKFDVAFIADDDIIFKLHGWDNAYVEAINKTAYDHLVYNDIVRLKNRKSYGLIESEHPKTLQSYVADITDVQGAFFTITPEIIDHVGYYDTRKYNLWAYGHTDYTIRCCNAGFNKINSCYDIVNSNDYIELRKDNYKTSESRNPHLWNTPQQIKVKKEHLQNVINSGESFVEYNTPKQDLDGKYLAHKYTFITINRDRDYICTDLFDNLKKYYDKDDYEVIVVTQADNKSFKRGQLLNIGFLNSQSEIIILIDNDIRFFEKLDFESLLNDNPIIPFKRLTQLCDGVENEVVEHPFGFGGLNVFTRTQFIRSCGYSNLFFGWGGEDNCMSQRIEYEKLDYKFGHVYHGKERKVDEERFAKVRTSVERKKYYDGYLHTLYDVILEYGEDNRWINVNNIRVPYNFQYKRWLKKQQQQQHYMLG